MFGKFTAYMLGLASKSGNMTDIYKATAKFLDRNMEFRKSLRSALITPAVTLFVLFLAVLFYVGYIFPETAKLFEGLAQKLEKQRPSEIIQQTHSLKDAAKELDTKKLLETMDEEDEGENEV